MRHTSTVNREVTTITRREVVAIEAADDEGNQKLRDTEFPAERSGTTCNTPWTRISR